MPASIRPAGRRDAPDHGEVPLSDPWSLELPGEELVRRRVLGGDDDPRGVLVQPVHDAGPRVAPPKASGEPRAVGEQGVHEGARAVPAARVHDHALRLVDHDRRRRSRRGSRAGSPRRRAPGGRIRVVHGDPVPELQPPGQAGPAPVHAQPGDPGPSPGCGRRAPCARRRTGRAACPPAPGSSTRASAVFTLRMAGARSGSPPPPRQGHGDGRRDQPSFLRRAVPCPDLAPGRNGQGAYQHVEAARVRRYRQMS